MNGLTKKGFFSLLGFRLLEQQWSTKIKKNFQGRLCLLLPNRDNNAQQSGWNQIMAKHRESIKGEKKKGLWMILTCEKKNQACCCLQWALLVFKCSDGCFVSGLGLYCFKAPILLLLLLFLSHPATFQTSVWRAFSAHFSLNAPPVVRSHFYLQPLGGARLHRFFSHSLFSVSCFTHFFLFLPSRVDY